MRMYVSGEWVDKASRTEVLNAFDNRAVDTVPQADHDDVDAALASAVRGARAMAALTAYDRYQILHRAAESMAERSEELARTITLEEGKTLAESRFEAARAVETMTLSAEEAKRLGGETLPLDAARHGAGKVGLTLRVPCGVVVAITPFNFPLNLVCHKVGPALAAGNAVICKPASDTPLSALKLTEILLQAGLPEEGIQCLTGPGGSLGERLCGDERVRKITFTGSHAVGQHLCRIAGLKKMTMELSSNSPLVVMGDADLEKVAAATVATGYANAGQVCISAQRVLVDRGVYADFTDLLREKAEAVTVGDPLREETQMGAMIREADAQRVSEWIHEAASSGARLVTGGARQGTLHAPTVLADVDPRMRVACDELFGPAVALTPVATIDDAIRAANDTPYGLSAGIFTQNLDWAMRFAREVHAGNLHINWGPQWRADLMPYGGLKDSGMGKEGPRAAVEEMTEAKMVVLHLRS